MKTFTDNTGKSWAVTIDVTALKRIKTLAGVDLLDAINGSELLRRLTADPCLLVDVVFSAVKPEADRVGVTDEVFGQAMCGQAISDATDALIEGLVEFLPPHQGRPLTKAYGKVREALTRGWAEVETAIDRLDLEAELKKIRERSGESSTSARGSSE